MCVYELAHADSECVCELAHTDSERSQGRAWNVVRGDQSAPFLLEHTLKKHSRLLARLLDRSDRSHLYSCNTSSITLCLV